MVHGERFSLPAAETLASDIYFGGENLDIAGRVNVSLVAGCKTAQLSGTILRNACLAAQNVSLSGTVSGDLLAFCADL